MNGVIVNIWQFSKRYFPKSHLKVIKKIMDMASEGVEIIYITGNHDDMLRKFSGTTIGEISIVDKKVLDLDGKKSVVFSCLYKMPNGWQNLVVMVMIY